MILTFRLVNCLLVGSFLFILIKDKLSINCSFLLLLIKNKLSIIGDRFKILSFKQLCFSVELNNMKDEISSHMIIWILLKSALIFSVKIFNLIKWMNSFLRYCFFVFQNVVPWTFVHLITRLYQPFNLVFEFGQLAFQTIFRALPNFIIVIYLLIWLLGETMAFEKHSDE